eukprot:TRINITY_DN5999_c0_g1_i1.p1 TRINITY_DN5999_c0_g1~~TRINITY_DN5999_c0_g1_i1.p1  ORF type:complete len:340 (-),score=69.12 TRINITY_DN5999_c0_g1_i1:80-1099(-)
MNPVGSPHVNASLPYATNLPTSLPQNMSGHPSSNPTSMSVPIINSATAVSSPAPQSFSQSHVTSQPPHSPQNIQKLKAQPTGVPTTPTQINQGYQTPQHYYKSPLQTIPGQSPQQLLQPQTSQAQTHSQLRQNTTNLPNISPMHQQLPTQNIYSLPMQPMSIQGMQTAQGIQRLSQPSGYPTQPMAINTAQTQQQTQTLPQSQPNSLHHAAAPNTQNNSLLLQQHQLQQQHLSQTNLATNASTATTTSTPHIGSQSTSIGDGIHLINTPPPSQILYKRKLQDMLHQIDSRYTLDPEVEELLVEIAEEFVENATSHACQLAKHRKSESLEVKDLQLHLGS